MDSGLPAIVYPLNALSFYFLRISPNPVQFCPISPALAQTIDQVLIRNFQILYQERLK